MILLSDYYVYVDFTYYCFHILFVSFKNIKFVYIAKVWGGLLLMLCYVKLGVSYGTLFGLVDLLWVFYLVIKLIG